MPLSRPPVVLILVSFAVLCATSARADAQQQATRPSSAASLAPPARESHHNSLSDSVRRVQRERGRVLSAERVPFEGGEINRVKYVDDRGRVRYMDEAAGPRQRIPSYPERNRADSPVVSARDDNPSGQ